MIRQGEFSDGDPRTRITHETDQARRRNNGPQIAALGRGPRRRDPGHHRNGLTISLQTSLFSWERINATLNGAGDNLSVSRVLFAYHPASGRGAGGNGASRQDVGLPRKGARRDQAVVAPKLAGRDRSSLKIPFRRTPDGDVCSIKRRGQAAARPAPCPVLPDRRRAPVSDRGNLVVARKHERCHEDDRDPFTPDVLGPVNQAISSCPIFLREPRQCEAGR